MVQLCYVSVFQLQMCLPRHFLSQDDAKSRRPPSRQLSSSLAHTPVGLIDVRSGRFLMLHITAGTHTLRTLTRRGPERLSMAHFGVKIVLTEGAETEELSQRS